MRGRDCYRCNKGLGYGMAVGLAKAGADIVGVNRSDDNDIKKYC